MHKITRSQFGFTLVELMVTLAVVAILLGIAAPSFNEMLQANRVITKANDVLSSLTLARSEAVKQSVQVVMRRSGATDKVWDGGWQVFTDWDGDGVYDDDGSDPECDVEEDCLLRVYDDVSSDLTIRTGNNYALWVGFRSNGTVVQGASGTFTICGLNKNVSDGRQVVVNGVGRVQVNEGAGACP